MRLLLIVSAVACWACGGTTPKPGDACTNRAYYCKDGTAALECRDGTIVELPCRGPQGCTSASGQIQCDMSQNLEDDLCASSSEGQALCVAGGTAVLECREGAFSKTNTCSSCEVQNNQVVCTP
jgi:hypothetical protein